MENRKHFVKISFIGDIMCEKPLLQAAKCSSGGYDFSSVFSPITNLIGEADYVVGNLETVLAGPEAAYTNHLYSFNSPDDLAGAIKDAGIDMVTTANNHCLDRGINGLRRTFAILDQYGIEHTGTFAQPDDDRIFIKGFNDLKIAILAYTYGTNYQINSVKLAQEDEFSVNLLQPQQAKVTSKKNLDLKSIFFKVLFKVITIEQWIKLKKSLKIRNNRPTVDDSLEHISEKYISRLESDIEKAKSAANYVVLCLHCGGQFNEAPGQFSQFMMDLSFKNGVDLVIGTHPHVVQGFEQNAKDSIGFYSLGSINISPSAPYLVEKNLPQYSIMLHLYLINNNGKLKHKITFTILKYLENRNGNFAIWPVFDLLKSIKEGKDREKLINEVTEVYNRFMKLNNKKIDIINEYILREPV